jgi:diaminopimelate decarboxylase
MDLGGGFWPRPGEWLCSGEKGIPTLHEAATIERFARELAKALERSVFPHVACRIWLEPGRWLCNDAMHLLVTVVDRKDPDLVITDGGTHAIGWERFEHDYFPVINLTRPDISEQECLILGSLCTPHDVWGKTYCGSDIQVGDVLLIPNQGAYTYGLRQGFIKPLPQSVVLGRGEA